ncbi:MAG TPA: xanthine dehydrogenase family protein molybdopterin-binding subunit [Candidatus Binatia bacterium]|nr:xanthine dehydrogenase family protein molybdopterin-binding subunit [Candidatus Binatia bacterium]
MHGTSPSPAKMIGARVARVEDPRFLRGRASYVDDLKLPGTLHLAFVRSPHAHARIARIDGAAALALPGVRRVLTGADVADRIRPMGFPFRPEVFPPTTFKQSKWPCLAVGKVRHVGEPVALVVAESRYLAEDAAELVQVEYDPLPAVVDPEQALAPGAPLVHEEFGDNLVITYAAETGDVEAAFRSAAFVLRERFRSNRHCALPLEGRATLARAEGDGSITLWTSSQTPHTVRTRIADLMGIPEQMLRVIAPDVGGGFGLKAMVFAEELLSCFLARELGVPVRWTEDRREHFVNSFHAKDDVVDCEMGFAADGTALGIRVRILGDLGAYAADPWHSAFEALQITGIFPGPYKIPNYAFDCRAVCTNKTTLSVYRGVGVPAAVWVHEHMMDLAARRLGMDPAELRRRNMIRPEEFPYRAANGSEYDSGSTTEALADALSAIDYDGFRRRQREARAAGRHLGIGIATYVEPTTWGTQNLHAGGVDISSYESANVRMDPNGGVVVSVGTLSHGQGHFTTYAQMVADQLGVRVEDVKVVQGDTQATPYGWGTWGSRSMVAGGGAVVKAAGRLREKMLRIAAHLLEVSPTDLEVVPGKVQVKGVPTKCMTPRDVARTAIFSTWDLPKEESFGLEATEYYDPPPLTWTNATHVVEVEVDVDTGLVRIARYVVVEDCGTMINPMIIEGQVVGAIAQGIGMALYEHLVYDDAGQLLTTSLMDYLAPTACDVPRVEIGHRETPSPLTVNGVKGVGEGGTIGAPAAIANAVADALAPWNVKVTELPLSPERVFRLVARARGA